jgi:peptidoglycan/xylan/chitin deacetylase (PgdA/CDA1 family)
MYHMIDDHIPNERKRNKWKVKPKDFEKQMAWFSKNNWTSYTISELTELKEIPFKSFCITFDDGYEDNFTNAFPVLKKYNFKSTIYLVPNYEYNSWENFKNKKFDKLLSKEQIIKMMESGLIEFGSHTLHHKNLLTISKDEAYEDMIKSKILVEDITKNECKAFAYPYGKYDEELIQISEKIGYTNATVVKRGFFDYDKLFEIKRVGILGTESFLDFYLKITRIRNKI